MKPSKTFMEDYGLNTGTILQRNIKVLIKFIYFNTFLNTENKYITVKNNYE